MRHRTPFDGKRSRGAAGSPPLTGVSSASGISAIPFASERSLLGGRRDSLRSNLDDNDHFFSGGDFMHFGVREPGNRKGSVGRDLLSMFPDPVSTVKKRGREKNRDGHSADFSHITDDDEASDLYDRYMASRRQLAQLRRSSDEEREKSALRIMQLERELSLEKKRLEQKETEARDANEAEENCRKKLKAMELEFMQERHQFMDQASKQEKANRRQNAVAEEEIQLLKVQVAEFRDELSFTRVMIEEKEKLVSDLQNELQRGRDLGRSTNASEMKDQVKALNTKIKCLDSENTDLKLLVDSLRHGAATEGRAEALNRELHVAQQEAVQWKEKHKKLETELLESRKATSRADFYANKLEALKSQRDALLEVEASRDQLLAEREEWNSLYKQFISLKRKSNEPLSMSSETKASPMTIVRELLETEQSCRVLAKQKGDLEVSEKSCRISLAKAQEMNEKSSSKNRELENQYNQLQDAQNNLEKKLAFVISERDSLLRVVASLREESFSRLPHEQKNDEVIKNLKEKNDAAIADWSERLEAAHSRIAELENSANELIKGGQWSTVQHKRPEDLEKISKEKMKLEESLENALNRVAELEHQVQSGAFNPKRTKILHLAFNPERKAMDAINSSTGTGNGDDGSSTKRLQRLLQTFKERTGAFKEAVYLLTGYKIDMMEKSSPGEQMLRLRSIFAERPTDELLFQWDRDGKDCGLSLVETPFARDNLDDNTLAYLTNCNSVPAFLATLTLDLFSKQTLAL